MTNSLPNNYKLNTRYTILHQIGQGGFGITYKAHDSMFDRVVCIKELFINGNSRREESLSITSQSIGDINFEYFKTKFLEEAQKLTKFEHPNIVKVLEYFEANNTAYMVMVFIEGKSLKEYVQEKGKLAENEALLLFTQLLDATKNIHKKNFLHRDIKPDNIIITPENKVVLIDFGTAKFHSNDTGSTSTLVLLSHGFAPPEQYSNEHKKGAYTDIYALGATLYFMLTGIKPIQATDRTMREMTSVNEINPDIKKKVVNVITKTMQLKPSERHQNVEQLITEIERIKYVNKKSSIQLTNLHKYILWGFVSIMLFGLFYWTQSNNEKYDEIIAHEHNGYLYDSRDGKTYKTVKIGKQIWMADNLAYKPKNGNYWTPGNNTENLIKYGYLYNWKTACMVCPSDWHLPSDYEWTELINYLGGDVVAGIKMNKKINWYQKNNDTEYSGFSAQHGGYFSSHNLSYPSISSEGYWWSSSENDEELASYLNLNRSGNIIRSINYKLDGLSIRCIKN
jgi:uncharacterized protein (TIGR02145 family)